jgi:hypothetical protein
VITHVSTPNIRASGWPPTRVKRIAVVVKPGCVVHHDGAAHHVGQVIELLAAEGRSLLEQDVVEKA